MRSWLEGLAQAALDVAQQAIDWLDQIDAAGEDREDDDREIVSEDDTPSRGAA